MTHQQPKPYTEGDWKLFRKLLPEWQEARMERLVAEYAEICQGEGFASEKFWALRKRIEQDRRLVGVLCQDMSRSKLMDHLLQLILEGTITESDLEGFSQGLREHIGSAIKALG